MGISIRLVNLLKSKLVYLIAYIAISFALINILTPTRIFADERIYVKAGISYINGLPPFYCNFEHPPLAKYIIGLFHSLGVDIFLPSFCIALSTFLVSLMILELTKNYRNVIFFAILVYSDALILNSLFFRLLDPIATLFTFASIYALIKSSTVTVIGSEFRYKLWLYTSSFFAGLAIASKWSSLYVLIPVFLTFFIGKAKEKNILAVIKEMNTFIVLSLFTYFITFIIDFISGGFKLFLEHHIKMIEYMSWRHGFTLPLFINGLMTLLCKVSLWHYKATEYLTVWLNKSVLNYSLKYVNVNATLIDFEPWLGSFSWILVFYCLPRLMRRLKYNKSWWLIISATIGAMTLPLLHGNIGWYYLFFAFLAPAIISKYYSDKKQAIIIIIIVNVIQVLLLQTKIISPKYSFKFK